MDEVQRMLVERSCEQLLYRYSRAVDFGHASRLADLFTEDGTWEADDLVLSGRAQIRAHFTRREQVTRRVSRHVCTNVWIDVVSPTQAQGLCYFLNFRHDRADGDESLPVPARLPKYSGEYHDDFVLTADGWHIARHHVDVTFLRPSTRGTTSAEEDAG